MAKQVMVARKSVLFGIDVQYRRARGKGSSKVYGRIMEVELLEAMARGGHDRLIAAQDEKSGLRAWISLHHPRFGIAFGGIRVWSYRSEGEAALDCMRLSQAMTYKCVLAGVRGGGAKSVVLADRLLDRNAAMGVLGQKIEELGGGYLAGPDVGFTEGDQLALARHTKYLARHGSALRPAAEATAEGTVYGMRSALKFLQGDESLSDVTVAIQGLGAVGYALAARLIRAGAVVYGADTDPERNQLSQSLGVHIVDPGAIYEVESDIFSPCALGGTLHDLSIQRLRTRLIAGAANNVLARNDHAQLLERRGILFVPDFILNAGGLIEGAGHSQEGRVDWTPELRRIGITTYQVLERAREESCTSVQAAYQMARESLEAEESDPQPHHVEIAGA